MAEVHSENEAGEKDGRALLHVPPQSGAPTWGKGAAAASSTLLRVLPREVTEVPPKSHTPLLRANNTWDGGGSHRKSSSTSGFWGPGATFVSGPVPFGPALPSPTLSSPALFAVRRANPIRPFLSLPEPSNTPPGIRPSQMGMWQRCHSPSTP